MIVKKSLLSLALVASSANSAILDSRYYYAASRRLKRSKMLEPAKEPESGPKKSKKSKKTKTPPTPALTFPKCSNANDDIDGCGIDVCVPFCRIEIDGEDQVAECPGFEGRVTPAERQCNCDDCVREVRFVYTPSENEAQTVSYTVTKTSGEEIESGSVSDFIQEISIGEPGGDCLSASGYLINLDLGGSVTTIPFNPTECDGQAYLSDRYGPDGVDEDGLLELSGFSCSATDINSCRAKVFIDSNYAVNNGDEPQTLTGFGGGFQYIADGRRPFGYSSSSGMLTLQPMEQRPAASLEVGVNICLPSVFSFLTSATPPDTSPCDRAVVDFSIEWGELPS